MNGDSSRSGALQGGENTLNAPFRGAGAGLQTYKPRRLFIAPPRPPPPREGASRFAPAPAPPCRAHPIRL